MMARAPVVVSVLTLTCLWSSCAKPLPTIEAPRIGFTERRVRYEFNSRLLDLDNGMRVLAVPDQKTNLIKIDVRYRFGAAQDPPGKAGLAHLVEHLMFEIPTSGPGSQTVGQYLGQLALYYNAYTTWDETHYTVVAPENLLNAMLMLEAQRMQARCEQIDAGVFEREREVVRNELRQRSGVGRRLARLLHSEVYADSHPYHRAIGGTDGEVSAITKDDVCRFIERYYKPNAAILVLSGRLRAEHAMKISHRFFDGIAGGAPIATSELPSSRLRGTASEHRLPIDEATALIAFPTTRFDAREAALDRVLRALLERKLYHLAREHKYITSVDVSVAGGVRAPLTVVNVAVTQPARLKKAVTQVFELHGSLTRGLSKIQLEDLVEQKRAELLLAMEPFMSEAIAVADYLQYSGHERFILPTLEAFAAIEPDHLKRRSRQLFRRRDSHVLYIYPDENASSRERRADLLFSPKEFELQDWRLWVDESQADRDVRITTNGIQALTEEYTLDNGLRVMLAPMAGYPVVDIRLVLPGGSWHEPEELPGLADMAARMMSPGPFRVSPRENATLAGLALKSFLAMGGDIDGSARATTTTLRISGMSMYLDGLLWQLYWQARTGTYDRDKLAAVRDLLGRGDRQEEARGQRQQQVLREKLFGRGHPYARSSTQTQLLARITTDDLQRFRDRHHRANGATLIVSGEFPVDYVKREVARLFGSLPQGEVPTARIIPAARGVSTPTYLGFPNDRRTQLRIVLAMSTPVRGFAAMPQRKVLQAMLELEMSSLRERMGATYGAQVSYSSSTGPGVVFISASVDRQRASEAYRAMVATLEQVRQGKSVAAFVRARRKVLRGLLADSIDSQSVAEDLELFAARGINSDFWVTMARKVAKMRMSDLTDIVAEDLAPERMITVVEGDAEAMKGVFDSLGVTDYAVIE